MCWWLARSLTSSNKMLAKTGGMVEIRVGVKLVLGCIVPDAFYVLQHHILTYYYVGDGLAYHHYPFFVTYFIKLSSTLSHQYNDVTNVTVTIKWSSISCIEMMVILENFLYQNDRSRYNGHFGLNYGQFGYQ